MPRRDKASQDGFWDGLVASIGSILFAMITLTLIYSYVAYNLYEHHQSQMALVDLDKLLALRAL
jgi:hypothetical protein